MTTSRPTFRSSLQFSVMSVATMFVLGIGSSIAIARVYGIRVIGENALSLAPTTVLAYLSTVREQVGLVRELVKLPHRAPRVAALFYVVLGYSFGLTVVVAAVVLAGTWFVFDGPVGRPDLFLPAVVQTIGFVVLTNTAWNVDMVLSAFRAGRELFHIRLWQAMAYLAIAVGVGAVWTSVWALVLAMIGSWATALVHRLAVVPRFMTFSAPRQVMRDAFRRLPSILRYGAKLAPGVAADGIGQESATWVLGSVAQVSAVGAYNRAATLGQRIGDVNMRAGEMLFPTLVERKGNGDEEGFGRSLMETMRYTGAGLMLIAAAGGGAAGGVMEIFGTGFSEGSTALALLLALAAVGSFNSGLTLALYAVDRPGLPTIVSLVRLAVLIPTCIALSFWLGVTGAALALLVTYIASSTSLYLIARSSCARYFHGYWPLREVVALALAFVGGFASAWGVDRALAGVFGTVAALAVGTIAFVVLLVGLGGVNARDRGRIRDAREVWRTRRAPMST